MKNISLLFIIIFSYQFSFSQGGIWTWISGSSTFSDPGVYGTQGVPSVNNFPPGAYEYCEWKDKQGNFWLYGGVYPDKSDLWKFNPQTLEWTWVKGNGLTGVLAVYGTQGVPDPSNTPGGRCYASITWVDTSGNFWLFGGSPLSGGYKADLWKYEPGTNEWTWVSGSALTNANGVHGVQGIPSVMNRPGARMESSSAWVDLQNNLWLFGGYGIDDVSSGGYLNDLMKYNIATNEWTWMKGSALVGAFANWGTKNVASVTNDPGARQSYSHWVDTADYLWMMGGSNANFYNDVWCYDIGLGNWTWKAGPNTINDTGRYFGTCIVDSLNMPEARTEHRSSVQDPCGRFWMYGGANFFNQNKSFSDLWVFDTSSLNWILLSGSNQLNPPYNYGIKGVASPANAPPARLGANAWWGNDNRFYMFGGQQSATNTYRCADLWVFTPDSLCIAICSSAPIALFDIPSPICPGTCISVFNNSINATSYQWFFPGASPDTSSAYIPINICYANPGNYDVQLIASNATGSDTLLLPNYITVYPQPPPQGIIQGGDTLFANAGAISYQWYFNGNMIPGATNSYYIATASGDYNVVATDINGCEVEAVINNVVAGLTPALSKGEGVVVFPNPVAEELSVDRNSSIEVIEDISVYNMLGEKIFLDVDLESMTVNCRPLKTGIYYLEIISTPPSGAGGLFRSKFVKQ